MNNEVIFMSFKIICNFVNDLESVYGSKYKPLKLYHRLINQTKIGHDKAIEKHVSIFRDFCVKNRDAIYENDASKIKENSVSYSNKVYINFVHIFSIADSDTKPIIWKHLLTISAVLDPTGNAKNILKKNAEENKDDKKETDFLTDIISKVENTIDPNQSPAEAMSSILKSGIVTDLLGSMEGNLKDGNLDMSKLLGSVQKMISTLAVQTGDDPESKKAVNMVNSLVNTMGSGQQPDISNMMGMMSALMGQK